MRLLVCGGRDYCNKAAVFAALDRAHAKRPVSVLIHGGSTHTDGLAEAWAWNHDVPDEVFSADWMRFGAQAGAVRDALMLANGKPDAVMAFPGGSGTAHMVGLALKAGLPVWQPEGV